jgi:hypothetical protein
MGAEESSMALSSAGRAIARSTDGERSLLDTATAWSSGGNLAGDLRLRKNHHVRRG